MTRNVADWLGFPLVAL